MSRRNRGIAASALLAGTLGLFPLAAQAAPAHPSGTPRAAAVSPSLFGSLVSQLARMMMGGPPSSTPAGPPSSVPVGPPVMDGEGPGICPHGR